MPESASNAPAVRSRCSTRDTPAVVSATVATSLARTASSGGTSYSTHFRTTVFSSGVFGHGGSAMTQSCRIALAGFGPTLAVSSLRQRDDAGGTDRCLVHGHVVMEDHEFPSGRDADVACAEVRGAQCPGFGCVAVEFQHQGLTV